MTQHVDGFPLCAKLKDKLKSSGFRFSSDFTGLRAKDLVRDVTGIAVDEAVLVVDHIQKMEFRTFQALQSAWTVFLRDSSSPSHITTFSTSLDELFGGRGIPLGCITEVCGAPGIGKTQLCIQLAVNALIPKMFGGVGGDLSKVGENDGERVVDSADSLDFDRDSKTSNDPTRLSRVVVLDTEGSFVPQRVFEIAAATAERFKSKVENSQGIIDAFDPTSICDNILVCRCVSLQNLFAAFKHLESLFERDRVVLVIIDSISMHFRQDVDDLARRTRMLNGLLQDLSRLVARAQLNFSQGPAVLLTNQMTTKIYSDPRKQSHLIPALGDSWGHAPNQRLLLHWDRASSSAASARDCRFATLFKSSTKPEVTVSYRVTAQGIRDCESYDERNLVLQLKEKSDLDAEKSPSSEPPVKRPRLE